MVRVGIVGASWLFIETLLFARGTVIVQDDASHCVKCIVFHSKNSIIVILRLNPLLDRFFHLVRKVQITVLLSRISHVELL